ncbi:MAG: hypothetical protein H6828_14300 [Planctomycetes bacterium]|nr:hypothetical protein [Planctomycetota bacterium]
MKSYRALGLLGAAVASLLFLILRQAPTQHVRDAELDGREESIDHRSSQTDEAAAPDTLGVVVVDGAASQTPSESRLALDQFHEVVVADLDGNPIVDAEVTLCAVLGAAVHPLAAEKSTLLELEERGSSGRTDASGHCRLVVPGERDCSKAIMWASKPGYLTVGCELERASWSGASNLVLVPAGAVHVRVSDPTGNPLVGAQVHCFGLRIEDARIMGQRGPDVESLQGGDDLDSAYGALRRKYVTNVNGVAHVAACPRTTLLVVSYEGLAPTMVAQLPGDIEIAVQLGQGTFRTGGSLARVDGGALPEGMRVLVRWMSETGRPPLGVFRVNRRGEWGPATLPVPNGGSIQFNVEGGDCFTEPLLVDVPENGKWVQADFVLEPGYDQLVHVLDEDDEPVVGAEVDLWWQGELSSPWRRAWTDERGLALITGCRMGATASCRARAENFTVGIQDAVGIVHDEPVELRMQRAVSLGGHVSYRGHPVEDFNVHVISEFADASRSQAFRGRRDGSFLMNSLSKGRKIIFASAVGRGDSTEVVVEADAGLGHSDVELELLEGFPGIAVVLDALTGRPLSSATAVVRPCLFSQSFEPLGSPIQADPSGAIRIEAVSGSEPTLEVSAPGYGSVIARGVLQQAGVVDFGEVALSRAQILHIVLSGRDELVREGWWFRADGTTRIPYTLVPDTGRLDIPDVLAGHYTFELLRQDGDGQLVSAVLRAGVEWEHIFCLDGGCSIDVRPAHGESGGLRLPVAATVIFEGRSGTPVELTNTLDENGCTRFSGVLGSHATIEFYGGGELVSFTEVQLDEKASILVEYSLRHRLSIRFTSDRDIDFTRSVACIAKSLGSVGSLPWMTCGVDGTVEFGIEGPGSYCVFFYAKEVGVSWYEVAVGANDVHSVGIQVHEGVRLSLKSSDDGMPVGGASWSGSLPGTWAALVGGVTLASGASEEVVLPIGTYDFRVVRDGYWAARVTRELRGDTTVEVELRRVGNLRLTAVDLHGEPLAGVELHVRSVADEVGVDSWIARGELASSALRTPTDGEGHASVFGVPAGEYAWEARFPDGSTRSGTVQVPGWGWAEVEVEAGH